MKILLAFNVNAYGKRERGLSFEHYNLFLPLQQLGHEVIPFDFATLLQQHGKIGMNQLLLETLRRERPEVAIFALVLDEFFPEALAEARRMTRTLAYFFDDIWRREYCAHWAPHFDHFTTPIKARYRHYCAVGMKGAIYSPFGYNDQIYEKQEGPFRYDVSFVGGAHPWRSFVVDRLRRAGFEVFAAGAFWPNGTIGQKEMIEVFNGTKVNLNLSNAPQWDARYLLSSWRGLRNTLLRHTEIEVKALDGIKARHFEIAGCGGFQLSYYCEDLERHFEIGDEVAVYVHLDDLIEKVAYYLRNETPRRAIAAAGYQRARRDHTAAQRLTSLLAAATAGPRQTADS